jgi:hypothetical protein
LLLKKTRKNATPKSKCSLLESRELAKLDVSEYEKKGFFFNFTWFLV